MGGARQNDVTGRAEKGIGGCEGRLPVVTAPGYLRAGGGGRGVNPLETGNHLPFSLCFHLFPSISLSLISGWL